MRLTELSRAAGCAGKLAPQDLDRAIRAIPRQNYPEVLVGYENSDDAGVYQLTPDIALVQTVDFFSPVVDDPYTYGAIAAANALSDVYAMGGQPRTALSILGFPSRGIDFSILGEMMRGGTDKLTEAGVALLGGHSLRDDEIKFGYAITGIIDTKKIKQNKGARPGNRLLLTKPLGTGLITTALKRGRVIAEHLAMAMNVMTELNQLASEIALDFEVDAMTDITGFGLAGHAIEVAKASMVSIHINHGHLPLLPGVLDYSAAGFCAGGLESNREFFSPNVEIGPNISSSMQNVLFDPQTSGGLLIFVRSSDAGPLMKKLHGSGIPAADIGSAGETSSTLLKVS